MSWSKQIPGALVSDEHGNTLIKLTKFKSQWNPPWQLRITFILLWILLGLFPCHAVSLEVGSGVYTAYSQITLPCQVYRGESFHWRLAIISGKILSNLSFKERVEGEGWNVIKERMSSKGTKDQT